MTPLKAFDTQLELIARQVWSAHFLDCQHPSKITIRALPNIAFDKNY